LEQEQISRFFYPSGNADAGPNLLIGRWSTRFRLRFADPSMAVLEVLACHAYIPKENR